MTTITLARHAMATRFEIVLHGDNPAALRAAGEEALNEIDRLESQLSLYRPESEISHINARAAAEPVKVSPRVFALLQRAQRFHQATGGAFDVSIAPLVRCWGFMGGAGKVPDAAELACAKSRSGMAGVRFDPENFTVRFDREGMMLDLGAIGKGYAVEQAADLLREAGVRSALIHGGTSTVYAVGQPPGAEFWKIAVEEPPQDSCRKNPEGGRGESRAPSAILAEVPLRDEGLSVSAVWGRSFEAQGRSFGHVLDPRTGDPVRGSLLAAVVSPSATESDALSTALLVLGPPGQERIGSWRPGIRSLLITEELAVHTDGISVREPPPRAVRCGA